MPAKFTPSENKAQLSARFTGYADAYEKAEEAIQADLQSAATELQAASAPTSAPASGPNAAGVGAAKTVLNRKVRYNDKRTTNHSLK